MAVSISRFLGTFNKLLIFNSKGILGIFCSELVFEVMFNSLLIIISILVLLDIPGSIECRCFSALPDAQSEPAKQTKDGQKGRKSIAPLNFRFIYPEFLPNPDIKRRNYIREKLERLDMMSRRERIDLPEFYVGKKLCRNFNSNMAEVE